MARKVRCPPLSPFTQHHRPFIPDGQHKLFSLNIPGFLEAFSAQGRQEQKFFPRKRRLPLPVYLH